MAHRSQCSSAGDNPLDPNYLPPHYREEYRLAIDALVENDLEGYYEFLQNADVVDFLSKQEAEYIKHTTQEPQQSTQPAQCVSEQHMDEGGEGSSDTYWPMHSDLDAPDLDLGWPQQHRFIGPTEVTTLVNPSEPDMPSIKEHARRLIKNSHQVVAVVMDMFTDVDIFADILDAAGRNVAVYVLLDEHNVHHFTNMVSNCRVNLENFPFIRVRTVSGLTYYCRTGKSFKGQMMNRFLLTDCRAVLSGNYSFMWSFEKIHRCIAHLFLGQLVTTFDEEFRVLFAQSKPLFGNVLAPVSDFSSLSDKLTSTDQTALFRDSRKVLPIENTGFMEWARHSFDERMYVDQKQMAFRKHELFHRSLDQGQLEMYNSSQHLRMDPSLIEQGPSVNLSEFKRQNSAHGTHVRVPSYRFMQHQQMVGFETHGRQMQREQQQDHPLYQRPGPDPGYAGYDKIRGYGYRSIDQYSLSEYPPEIDPEPYDPVLNYLSSTSTEMKDDLAKATSGEISLGLSNPERISIGQPYACQRSSTQKTPSEDDESFQGPNIDHETPDLKAKQGMRDWRIHSYLNAFNNTGDEDLSMQSPTVIEPSEPLKHAQVGSSGPVLPDSMFHTKELPKFQATSRLRKLQCYTKSVIPEVKKVPDTVITMASEVDATPSESSLTTEEDKTEVVEVKEPKEIGSKREEHFNKTYNAALQRSSRLKSSLIFSSQLEQHFSDTQTTSGQHDEEMSKNEKDQSKLPFSTPLLVKRRSFTREPFEWSRYIKPVVTDSTITESSKSDDLVPETGVSEVPSDDKEIKKQPTPTEGEQNVLPSLEPPNCLQDELLKTMNMELKTEQLTHSTNPFYSSMTNIDMSDPDCRLMFFKELAAQRKAEKNTPIVNITKKACIKTDHSVPTSDQRTETACQKIEPGQSEFPQKTEETAISISAKPAEIDQTVLSQEIKSKMSTVTCGQSHRKAKEAFKPEAQDPNLPKNVCQPDRDDISSNEGVLPGSTDAEKIELKRNQIVSDPTSSDSALVGSNTIEKECRPPDSSATGLSTSPISLVSPPSPNQSTQEVRPSYSPTMEILTTLPTTQCVPGKKQRPPAVPSESGTSTLSIPLESRQSASHNESVMPKNPEETKSKTVKTSFKTKKGDCRSPKPPRSKCASAPKPNLATLESSSTHSASSSASSILHPDPSETSLTPHPVTPETSLNPHPITAETSCTPHPAPSAASLSPHPVTTETSLNPHPITAETSSTPHPAPSAASLSPHPVTTGTSSTVNSVSSSSNSHPDSLKVSPTPPHVLSLTSFTSPCQENTPESQIQHSFLSEGEIESRCTATESCSSPESFSGCVLVASSEIDKTKVTTAKISATPDEFSSFSDLTSTESCESSFPKDIESCSSSTQTNSTSSVNPIVTEFNLIPNSTSVESSNPNLLIVFENSSLNKEPSSELCEESKSETSPEKLVCHESQIDGANVTPPDSESTSDQVIPMSSQSKNSKVSQSRFQSSTAKVLSNSNLRDDTKLLLEQISSNSQSRAELAKETAVTDDAKKEEAHRMGNLEERLPERPQSSVQHRTDQERQSLLQRIKSLRNENKVYSRFEVNSVPVKKKT